MFHLIDLACILKGRSLNPDVKEARKMALRTEILKGFETESLTERLQLLSWSC